MEEKKLTDEEIIEAFKGSSQNHGYFTEINGKWVKYEDVFDLIHRLQKAKEFFEKGYEVTKKIIDEKNEKICKSEEEIERLKDEKEAILKDYYVESQHCDVQKDIIDEQKRYIEYLQRKLNEANITYRGNLWKRN